MTSRRPKLPKSSEEMKAWSAAPAPICATLLDWLGQAYEAAGKGKKLG
jgi:hypothetical protein